MLGRRLIQGLLIATLAALIVLVLRNPGFFAPENLKTVLGGSDWAPLLFILAHLVASLFFVPRTLLAIAAGLMFGPFLGIVMTTIGAMTGSMAGFFLARFMGGHVLAHPWFKPYLSRMDSLNRRLDHGGWIAVAGLRILPVLPHTPVNYAFGLTQIGTTSYLIGSFIGLLPNTIWAVLAGAAGSDALSGKSSWMITGVAGLILIIASHYLSKYLLRTFPNNRQEKL